MHTKYLFMIVPFLYHLYYRS